MPRKNKPLRVESRNPNVRIVFRGARLNKELTQKALAEELEVKESYIRFIENGHVNPSIKKMIMFENYFEVSAKELFPDLYAEAAQQIAK